MRRVVGTMVLVLLLVSLLTGCAAPTPQVIEKEKVVEKPVVQTVVVEKEKVVEKPVVQTVVVEKEVEKQMPAGPVTLEVYDPTGAFEVTQLHAPRLDSLEGKTICQLSVDAWQAHRVLPLIQELIQKRFPTAKVIPYTEFPVGTGGIDSDQTAALIKEKGCQAVIVGNAG